MANAERVRVEVCYSGAVGHMQLLPLDLPAGSTLEAALQASGLVQQHGWSLSTLRCGIWGKVKPLDTPLRERDRVEVYRPLQVDPKEARRHRYRKYKPGSPAGSPPRGGAPAA